MSPRFLFTRHGEAAHNPLINAKRKAEGRALLDPELTEKGVEQATALRARIREEVPDLTLVVTSPLRRALQTTLLAFGADAPVVVTPLHTESGHIVDGDEVAGHPCQRGRSAEELQKLFPPSWDWSQLQDAACWTNTQASKIRVHGPSQDGFFHPYACEARLDSFRDWLKRQTAGKKGTVVVVGHSGFFKDFLGGATMKNCELLEKSI
eukprot:gnl/TRDRNA2_/TRDRNA2_199902_c0_seq1.p1 gnl/TRDRNA2_/TRDRNA2_199902_c0~~gnl/TRDRNA2_/TRDRNA2_199902_c0_seq1.p1  ORF type:complete len:208 (-),score=43.18 gnl/TRDRNA2_/TRDRNA2_199902_c0_seq1:97-720(-)